MPEIDRLFDVMLKMGGSDLHLLQGESPKVRVQGRIKEIPGEATLDEELMMRYLRGICEERQWTVFQEQHDLDFAYAKDEASRFRANYYYQIHGMAAVFRIIPTDILTLEDLKLPPVLRTFARMQSGLVLVTGPTGSGKSTTLAAVINEINETSSRYILTIEEPIEFVHPNKKSVFCQREVHRDCKSFADGLRAAGRQDSDVVLVGEMRDYETISLALTAAAMGTLVFGTLHTNSAVKTIDRIIDVFPHAQQGAARSMLAECIRGICAQLLLKTTDGKRVAVNEILLNARGLGASIRESNPSAIGNIIQSGKKQGMQSMDDAIERLLREKRISGEEAYLKALDKKRFIKFAPKL